MSHKNKTCSWFLIVAFVLPMGYPCLVLSQESIDISYTSGSILVHTDKIEPISHKAVNGFSIGYTFKNTRGQHWRKYYHFSNYGLNYTFKSFNNPDVLGNAHALTSFLKLSFLKQPKIFDIGFRGFAGFAYLTKTYNEFSNPLNQAISTHFNITSAVQLYTKFCLHPLFLEYSYGLNHFSNGLIKSPNLGINSLNNQFAVGWEFEQPATSSKTQKNEGHPLLRNEFWFYGSLGTKRIKDYDQNFLFYAASLNHSTQINSIIKLGFGIDFIHDKSLTQHAILKYNYTGEKNLDFRFGPNIQGEFLFGNLGFNLAYGFFFGDVTNYVSRIYYKVGVKYYAGKVIAIANIRAVPLFKAQVLEVGIACRFHTFNN